MDIGQVGIIKGDACLLPYLCYCKTKRLGLVGELNPRLLIAKARTIPLDQQAFPLRNNGNGCTYDLQSDECILNTRAPISTTLYQLVGKYYGRMLTTRQLWLVGLVAWFSLRVREVPGSTPGQAHIFLNKIKFLLMHGSWLDITMYSYITGFTKETS